MATSLMLHKKWGCQEKMQVSTEHKGISTMTNQTANIDKQSHKRYSETKTLSADVGII